jgi:hypothetical protein
LARRLSIAVAAIASLVAGAACAADGPSLVDGLQHYCVTNGNRATAILAEADADGWGPAPESLAKALPMGASGGGARVKKDGATLSILMVGDTRIPTGGANVDATICAVLSNTADAAATESQVASWVGVAPNPGETNANSTTYAYLDDPSGRKAILDQPGDARAKQLVASGKLRFVMTMTGPDMVMIAYIIPKM